VRVVSHGQAPSPVGGSQRTVLRRPLRRLRWGKARSRPERKTTHSGPTCVRRWASMRKTAMDASGSPKRPYLPKHQARRWASMGKTAPDASGSPKCPYLTRFRDGQVWRDRPGSLRIAKAPIVGQSSGAKVGKYGRDRPGVSVADYTHPEASSLVVVLGVGSLTRRSQGSDDDERDEKRRRLAKGQITGGRNLGHSFRLSDLGARATEVANSCLPRHGRGRAARRGS
jgi:hypothetical protein